LVRLLLVLRLALMVFPWQAVTTVLRR